MKEVKFSFDIPLLGCILFPIVFVLITMWTDRTTTFWLTKMQGYPVDLPWYIDALLTIIAPAALAINLISEIIRFCL